MTALPRRFYRDPAEQLLEAEAETCKGCRWRVVSGRLLTMDLRPEVGCNNPRKIGTLTHADKRCDEYEENNES